MSSKNKNDGKKEKSDKELIVKAEEIMTKQGIPKDRIIKEFHDSMSDKKKQE